MVDISKKWDNYLGAIVFYLFFPLLPIFLELSFKQSISHASLSITVSIYAISIGGSSRLLSIFIISIAVSIMFAFFYGVSLSHESSGTPLVQHQTLYSIITIIIFFVTSALEKYARHIVGDEDCWGFNKSK